MSVYFLDFTYHQPRREGAIDEGETHPDAFLGAVAVVLCSEEKLAMHGIRRLDRSRVAQQSLASVDR